MRTPELFRIYYRSRWKTWYFTLNPSTGLSPEVLKQWSRRSLHTLPPEFLQHFPAPRSRRDVKIILTAWIAKLRESSPPALDSSCTLRQWATRFRMENNPRAIRLLSRGKPYSPKTLDSYRRIIDGYILPSPLASRPLGEIGKQDLEQFFASLVQAQGARRTVVMVYTVLRMLFREYHLENPQFSDPFSSLQKPHYVPVKRDTLTEEELIRLFSDPYHFNGRLERFAFLLAYFCGLRRGEVLALHHEQIDLQKNIILVDRTWKLIESKKRSIGPPKWNKPRIVPLPEFVKREYQELFPRILYPMVFVYPDGSPCLQTWWQDNFYRALRRAGIDTTGRNIVPHTARHTLASILYQKGTPLRYLQDLLGHSDLKVTDLYVHTPAGALEEIGNQINKIPKEKS